MLRSPSEIRRAVRTAQSAQGDARLAVGAVLVGRSGRRRPLQTVRHPHDEEHGKRHDQEGDDLVDEQSVVERDGTGSLGVGDGGVWRRGLGAFLEQEEKIREVYVAEREPDRAGKIEMYARIQRQISEDLPQIYLWYPATVLIAGSRVGNIEPEASGSWYFIAKLTLKD